MGAFAGYAAGMSSPVTTTEEITPSDSEDLSAVTRAIILGTAGDVSLMLANDDAAHLYKNLQAGVVYPFRVKRVLATDTTATYIRGLS